MNKNFDRKLSIVGFFSLVVIYFYYSFLYGLGVIPGFLGGYVSLNAFLILPFALLWFLKESLNSKNLFFQLFNLFILSLIFSTVINLVVNYDASIVFLPIAAKTIMLSIVGYYIGANFNVRTSQTKRFLKFGCTSIVVLLILNIVFSQDAFANYKTFSNYIDGTLIGASYQQIGRTLLLACIMVYLLSENKNDAIAIIFMSIVMMPLIGSRNYGALLIAFLLLIFLKDLLRGKLKKTISLIIPLVIIAILYFFEDLLTIFDQSRFSDLLRLEESKSFQGRTYSFERTLELIASNPISGVFGHSVQENYYAHNILFIWGNYGFISFILIFCIVLERIYTFIQMSIKNFKILHYSDDILIPVVLISLIFLEGYISMLFIPIVFGILHLSEK